MKSLSGKQKTCKSCREKFTPSKPMQAACSIKCAIDLVNRDKARAQRAESRKAKERIKTKADHAREAQQAFNAWVRLRDKDLPCISCDRPNDGNHQRHASHYRSRGANPELAFDPLNVHASCAQCNSMKSGNIVEYRIRLRHRIGDSALEWLEGPHDPKRYTIEDLQGIKAHYRALVRELSN